jgi:hypothetical protein
VRLRYGRPLMLTASRLRWLVVVVALLLAGATALALQRSRVTECEQAGAVWDAERDRCDAGADGLVTLQLRKSARCVTDDGLRSCQYTVGHLKLDILGVGEEASVAVDGSDGHTGYGVDIALREGCVHVAPGVDMKRREPERLIENAFISTWTGEVYGSMVMCWVAGKNARASGQTMR